MIANLNKDLDVTLTLCHSVTQCLHVCCGCVCVVSSHLPAVMLWLASSLQVQVRQEVPSTLCSHQRTAGCILRVDRNRCAFTKTPKWRTSQCTGPRLMQPHFLTNSARVEKCSPVRCDVSLHHLSVDECKQRRENPTAHLNEVEGRPPLPLMPLSSQAHTRIGAGRIFLIRGKTVALWTLHSSGSNFLPLICKDFSLVWHSMQ